MGTILRNWRIGFASAFSIALILGAYALAHGFWFSTDAAHASTESALLAQIATRDSTGDGLPDWQKVLYGIPLTATTTDYFHLGMTDGEAVAKGLIVPIATPSVPDATSTDTGAYVDPSLPNAPADGTLTYAFAKSFFTKYLDAAQTKHGVLTESDLQQIANDSLATLAVSVAQAPDFKTAADLTVSGSGADAMRAFAAAAESALASKKSDTTKSEIFYLQDAVQNGDASALAALTRKAQTYHDMAVALAAIPVPQELAATDVQLVNALMHMSGVTADFTKVNTDPMATMLALQFYPQYVTDLGHAFIAVWDAYAQKGIVLGEGDPGALFVGVMPAIANQQSSAKGSPRTP